MNSPNVSCLISLYKCEKYLKKFLQNCEIQKNFHKYEFIFYHVCPTSNELKIMNKIKKKFPKNIVHIKKNKLVPLPKAWNECIKKSSKNILAIWNVDDLRTANSLYEQSTKFSKKIDFVFGNFKIVNKFGSTNGKLIRHDYLKKEELNVSMILGPFFMFKKKVIKKIGLFDEQLKSSADFDFALRLSSYYRGHCYKKNLGYYLNEKKGLSTNKNSSQSIENNIIYLRYGILEKLNFLELSKLYKFQINEIFYNNKFHKINLLFKDYEKTISKRTHNYEKKLKLKKNFRKFLEFLNSKIK